MFLSTNVPAEPLPEVPSPRRRRVYDPVVIQQHLSLWDSLHFTDKVGCRYTEQLSGVTVDSIVYRLENVLSNLHHTVPAGMRARRCGEPQTDRRLLLSACLSAAVCPISRDLATCCLSAQISSYANCCEHTVFFNWCTYAV